MARRVFFSFHFDRDVRRVAQVRQSWLIRPGGEAQPFYDKAGFETAKRLAGGIDKWIEEQLEGTSVTVVLYGTETYDREWVRHEMRRSHELGKGLLAIDIHNVKDPKLGTDRPGRNPLDHFTVERGGASVSLSSLHGAYDWVRHDGYSNIASWIEAAAKAAGR